MQKGLFVYKEKVIQEMEELNRKKIEKEVKEETNEIISKSKQTIRELKNKIQEEEKIKEKLTKKNLKLTKELKKQAEELEAERQKVEVMTAEMGEQKKREEDKQKKDQAIMFNQIYEKNIGSKILNFSNFDLKISLTDAKQKALFRDIDTSNLRLPDIKRIRIDNVSDSEADLSSFFENYTPNQLKFICINYTSTADAPIKSKIDIKSLSKAVTAAIKEVYIRLYEFSAADLQQFIKAACNSERIIFQRCSVHCSSDLKFGSKLKYNTNFLSFQYCGYTDYKELTTDWMTDPSCFSHIVDAIGSSGLRDSLTKLSIAHNQTLDKDEVQKLFNSKGMTNIEVVEEKSIPSTD